MGVAIPEPEESSEAMGNVSEGAGKDGSNGAGPGRNVSGGGTVGALVRKQDLGGDRGYAQGPEGVPPPGGATDHGDDRKMRGRRRVGVPLGSGCNGNRRYPPPLDCTPGGDRQPYRKGWPAAPYMSCERRWR